MDWRDKLDWRLRAITGVAEKDERTTSAQVVEALESWMDGPASEGTDAQLQRHDGTVFHGVELDAANAQVWLRVLVELDAGAAPDADALGLDRGWVADGFASGRLRYEQLSGLASSPDVLHVELASALRLVRALPSVGVAVGNMPADAIGVPGPPRPAGGKGVLIGVIDNVLDPRVVQLQDAGHTCVESYWFQDYAEQAGPAPYGYGTLYKKEQLQAAIDHQGALSPAHLPSPKDLGNDAHGTSITCIAAGRGAGYRGVAPGARVAFVAAIPSGPDAIADSQRLVDAVHFIDAEATRLGLSCVVNISLGDGLGPHDGSTILERALASVAAKPGRVVVVCAGNANRKKHATATLGDPSPMLDCATLDTVDGETIDVWYEGPGSASLEISLGGTTLGPFPATGGRRSYVDPGKVQLSIDSWPPSGALQRGVFRISLGDCPFLDHTQFEVRLRADPGSPQGRRLDAWIDDDESGLFFNKFEERTTVTSPGTARGVLTVGACEFLPSTSQVRSQLLGSSGKGPTLDERSTPHLLAVGAELSLVEPRDGGGSGVDVFGSGTSLAAPLVAGAAALILERQLGASTADVAKRLAALGVSSPDLPPRLNLSALFQLPT